MRLTDYFDTSTYRRLVQSWQKKPWAYYDSLGEVHFASNFVGNALARVNLYSADVPKKVTEEPVPDESGPGVDVVDSMTGMRGGQSNLLRLSAMNLFLPGEYVLAGYDGGFEVFSIDEFEVGADGKKYRIRGPGQEREELPSDGFYGRVWRPHPRWTSLADSPMRGVLNDCETLVLLGHQDRNLIKNRIAGSGLLLWPTELLEAEELDEDDSEDEGGQHPLMKKIQEMMLTPLKDETDPSSVVPGVFLGPAEYLKSVQYLTFDRPLDARSEAKKQEAVRRIAVGVDLPPEVLLGLAEVNHWTAWQVREETFQQHLQPLVELVVDAWTVTYYRPALVASGMDPAEAAKKMIWYDADDLIARPDKSMQAVELHERLVISDEALRTENGFDDTDAPDEEELERRLGQAMMQPTIVFPDHPELVSAFPPSRVPENDVPPTDKMTDRNVQPGPANSARPGA